MRTTTFKREALNKQCPQSQKDYNDDGLNEQISIICRYTIGNTFQGEMGVGGPDFTSPIDCFHNTKPC